VQRARQVVEEIASSNDLPMGGSLVTEFVEDLRDNARASSWGRRRSETSDGRARSSARLRTLRGRSGHCKWVPGDLFERLTVRTLRT